ncbi:MAG: hypothetical protein ACTSRK_14275 [Promethearchaeota archaeon]
MVSKNAKQSVCGLGVLGLIFNFFIFPSLGGLTGVIIFQVCFWGYVLIDEAKQGSAPSGSVSRYRSQNFSHNNSPTIGYESWIPFLNKKYSRLSVQDWEMNQLIAHLGELVYANDQQREKTLSRNQARIYATNFVNEKSGL